MIPNYIGGKQVLNPKNNKCCICGGNWDVKFCMDDNDVLNDKPKCIKCRDSQYLIPYILFGCLLLTLFLGISL